MSNTEIEEPVELSEEGRRKAWRLLCLLTALTSHRPDEPVSLDEIDHLGRVAEGWYDLHKACDALHRGCAVELLAGIYT